MYQIKITNLKNNKEIVCDSGDAILAIIVKEHATPEETMHGRLAVVGKLSPKDAMVAVEKLSTYALDKVIISAGGDKDVQE